MSIPLATSQGGTGVAAPEPGAILVGARTSPMEQVLPGEVGDVLRVIDKETLGYEALTAADVGAAATSHTHAQSDITDLVSDLAGKAASSHTHVQADITGLTTGSSPEFAAVNLGHASDTTLTRSAAGILAVEGKDVLISTVDYFKAYKSTDHTAIGTTFANITGLSLGTLSNGVMYWFAFYLFMDADAASTGIDVTVNSATGLTLARYSITYWTTANANTTRGFDGLWQGDTASTASNGTAVRLYKIEGMVQLSGAGTIEAQAKREAVGSGPNCRAGSWGVAWKLG